MSYEADLIKCAYCNCYFHEADASDSDDGPLCPDCSATEDDDEDPWQDYANTEIKQLL